MEGRINWRDELITGGMNKRVDEEMKRLEIIVSMK
jgi:hypothetical protein